MDRQSRAANKKDEVYERIVRRLMRAEWAFGQRIGVKELAAELGVSRQPVMTALNRLDGDGFVHIVPQVGCQVVNPSIAEVNDFFLMFQRLEGVLAELAAVRRSDGEMRELKSLQRQLDELEPKDAGALDDYIVLNRAFHELLHRMARSPMLAERQRSNFNMADFFISHSAGFGSLMVGTSPEHNAIIEALDRRAPERARSVAEVHLGTVAALVARNLAEILS